MAYFIAAFLASLLFSQAVASDANVHRRAVSRATIIGKIQQFAADFSYPRVIEVAKAVNYSGFAPDIVGRVDVTNAYIGNELNTEYIFGLFANMGQSNTTRLLGTPGAQTITELAIDGNVASFSTIIQFDWKVVTLPVQIDVWFLFNEQALIQQYDITFRRATWLFNEVYPYLLAPIAKELSLPSVTPSETLLHLRAAIDICTVHTQYCTGANQQYANEAECKLWLTTQRKYGEIWQAGQDTTLCRYIHKGMVQYRPEVHCPHIGKTGGGMCIARNYTTEVTQALYPKPFVGGTA